MATVIDFKDATPELDEIPETSDIANPCETCGRDVQWSGRGRKPRFCPDHRNGKSTGTKTRIVANEKLAEEAADVLCTANSLAGVGLLAVGLSDTQAELVDREDSFRRAAVNALKRDPQLARKILAGGAAGGQVALIVAYGVLVSAVFPVARDEWREVHPKKIRQ